MMDIHQILKKLPHRYPLLLVDRVGGDVEDVVTAVREREAVHASEGRSDGFSAWLAQDTAGSQLTAFEFMPRFALEIVLKHAAGAVPPLSGAHKAYALIELSSPDSGIDLREPFRTAQPRERFGEPRPRDDAKEARAPGRACRATQLG